MTDIRKLIQQMAAQETQVRSTQFLAPCVLGGQVRTRLAGMVYTFKPQPQNFEGWGIFQPINDQIATLIEGADLPQVTEYLQHFPIVRLRLASLLRGQTWLAYPVNEADIRQRLKRVKPVLVHLVTEGVPFEQVVVRWNGYSCWFEAIDRRSDPDLTAALQTALQQRTPLQNLQFKGMTPEMKTLYDLVTQRIEGFSQPQQDENRLRRALQIGGGDLQQVQDRGDYWTVDWTTANGERHTSAIGKNDLTVISSGICLDGRDRDFDLQSLVGVIEQREW
ncbi:hypothetical protein BST81_15805 [Leptolyngbya sp. 'hensonii']|uniref:hypothetical protein n=1 Tax=Leptolyngbya sp. 'hensonii' TaxID=1922337 RepID=UPI00094FF7C0|nr:hypothetical protein [Leptolyngbya sp. 'hensonii']OLP17282.1 hypothetical protein BST81_15805 [Leptolyngbya sp. 'hensonii']